MGWLKVSIKQNISKQMLILVWFEKLGYLQNRDFKLRVLMAIVITEIHCVTRPEQRSFSRVFLF